MRPSDRGPGLLLGDGVEIGEDVRFGAHVVVHPGTVIGDGCELQDGAIVGKPPKLARSSSAAGRAVDPLELGTGAVVCARAIVFAGARIGAGAILGDQSYVRERAVVGAGSLVGRGSAVDNDVVIGDRVGAILGKPPKLARHSAAAGRTVEPLELGPGAVVCARAIVFAGARVGPRAILGDQSYVRERAVVGAGSLIGRGTRWTTTWSSGARASRRTSTSPPSP